jgi:hypothetical protein
MRVVRARRPLWYKQLHLGDISIVDELTAGTTPESTLVVSDAGILS